MERNNSDYQQIDLAEIPNVTVLSGMKDTEITLGTSKNKKTSFGSETDALAAQTLTTEACVEVPHFTAEAKDSSSPARRSQVFKTIDSHEQNSPGVRKAYMNGHTTTGFEKTDVSKQTRTVDKRNDANGLSKMDAEAETKGQVIVELDAEDVVGQNSSSCYTRAVVTAEATVSHFCNSHKRQMVWVIKLLLAMAFVAYFIYCMHYRFGDEGSLILIVIAAGLVVKMVADRISRSECPGCIVHALTWYNTQPSAKRMGKSLRYALYVIALLSLSIYLGVDVLSHSAYNAQALIGIIALILGCFVFSVKPSKVNWHPVFWGFFIQFLFAILTLRTVAGYRTFKWIGDLVNEFVRLSDKGSNFVLGASFRDTNPGFFFETAGVIVFFNSCIFVLDYFGVLEFIILNIGRGLALCLETGPIESVVAAANIFIGLSEAPVLVRPYLPVITKSELHAIMTCGFSSISGAFMAMFIQAGAPPTHLLTACLISAPAALAISKLMYPEIETVDFEKQKDISMRDASSPRTTVQAISDGATFSIKLVATIMVNMMAFVSILNLIDHILIWVGERAGVEELTFNYISSYLFFPASWVMGIPAKDCRMSGYLLGLKAMATPFVAYKDLGMLIQNRVDLQDYIATVNGTWHYSGPDIILDATNQTLINGVLEPRSEVIITYAMCGISAFPAIGFTMGTLIPMSPTRKEDVVSLILRAFLSGNFANWATGAVAGVMFDGE